MTGQRFSKSFSIHAPERCAGRKQRDHRVGIKMAQLKSEHCGGPVVALSGMAMAGDAGLLNRAETPNRGLASGRVGALTAERSETSRALLRVLVVWVRLELEVDLLFCFRLLQRL